MEKITKLDNRYRRQWLWVVGRGPSLAKLGRRDFGQGPVIAINQAIEEVEKLHLLNDVYSMQKDKYFWPPKYATVLCHEYELYNTSRDELEKINALVFNNPVDFGIPWNMPSVVSAAAIGARWGCTKIVYLCCDSVFGDTGTFGAAPTYPENYRIHPWMVQRYAQHARIPVEWKKIV